jgi:uncharacterized membrane protein
MDQKTIAVVSYITFVGWIVALVIYNGNTAEKSSLARFHLRQSFGIFVSAFVLYFAINILGFIIPFFFLLNAIVGIGALIFVIIGLIAAANGEEKPLPLIGDFSQRTFTFIN